MNIHLMSPIGYTGYGYASLNILQSLLKTHNVGLTLIGNPNVDTEQQASSVQHATSLSYMIPSDSPCIKIWHQFDLLTKVGKGKYFAFPFFEVDTFNAKETNHLQFPDEIIVSSKWAKDVLQRNRFEQHIHIVPLGVDTTIFDHKKNQTTDKYVFVTVGKWEKRKAHDTIIDCFNKAFTETDNVELWMITHNPFLNQEETNQWISLVENSKLRSKIKIFPRLQNHEKLAEVLSLANCGVYISRGEGWNLELLETMAMNKPVIASNYSAHTEYCTKDNSFLVDMPETELAVDNKWFFGTSSWGKIGDSQIEQTIEHMRNCYKNSINDNVSGLETAQKLSWDYSAENMTKALKHQIADTLI